MSAIDYSGIRNQLKSILAGDTRTNTARIYIEEDPQFGLSDAQQAILICLDSRNAPPPDQRLSAGMRTYYHLQCTLVVAYFSMESFEQACVGRDALLGNMELVLMVDRTIGGKANSSWLEGGPMYSARNPEGSVWAALAETKLVIDVQAVNTSSGYALSYAVTYNGNNNTSGSVPVDGAVYPEGSTVTVLGNTGSLARTGYTFEDWNTAADRSGTDYVSGSTFVMSTANVTLYAKWNLPNLILLHFNGTDGSTVIVDNGTAGATWTAQGNAQLNTAEKKFGSSSLLLDGTFDDVMSTDIGSLLPVSGGWTIDVWVNFSSLPSTAMLFDYRNTAAGYGVVVSYESSGDALKLSLSYSGTSFNIANGVSMNPGFVTGTWYHVALVRDDSAGKYFLYVNGVVGITVVSALQVRSDLDEITVGSNYASSGSINGRMDEFRIADGCDFPNGTTFTPPAGQY